MTGESHRRRVMHTHAIRALLLAEDRSVGELGKALGITNSYVNGILNTEYGFTVDRWAKTPTGLDIAIWTCIPVPPHCPRPDPKPQPEIEE